MHPSTIRMQEHLENVKNKPQHVRENIALAISGGITLLVFVGWAGSLINSNVFALSAPQTTDTQAVASPLDKVAETKTTFSNLLGAAAASGTGSSSEPHIEIVDSPSAQNAPAPDQKVIHF